MARFCSAKCLLWSSTGACISARTCMTTSTRKWSRFTVSQMQVPASPAAAAGPGIAIVTFGNKFQVPTPSADRGYLCSAGFSTTSRYRGSEEERISRAYLGENLTRTVQKHDGNRLIYEVRGQALLRFVTLSFYATAATGIYLAPDFISSAWENEVLNQETVINLVAVACAVIGLPASLRLLSKRLVLKLYHNEARETYLAITQSLLLTNNMTKFSLGDVVVREKKSLLSNMFNLTTFKANRHPFHVNPYNFKLPSDFNHLLGYDRPV